MANVVESNSPSSNAVARRIDSRRFSIGPTTVYMDPPTCGKHACNCFVSANAIIEKALRESASVSAFGLVVAWITFFAGVIDRDCLFIASGVLIGLLLISTLLKRRQMISELDRLGVREVRRPFPRGAIMRSSSHVDVTSEDLIILNRIKALYVSKLVDSCVSMTKSNHVPGCNACIICLVECAHDEDVSTLPCEHGFHRMCLVDWFGAQMLGCDARPSCPTCRAEVRLTDEGMDAFMKEVCEPHFLGPHLSRRVHVVFDREPEPTALV